MADLQAAFHQLARALGASPRQEHGALVFETWHGRVPLVLRLRPSGAGAELALAAEGLPLPAIQAHVEDGLTRLSKRLRLSPRLTTGDPGFDGHVHVHTGLSAGALGYLAGQTDFRRGILSLLDQGAQA